MSISFCHCHYLPLPFCFTNVNTIHQCYYVPPMPYFGLLPTCFTTAYMFYHCFTNSIRFSFAIRLYQCLMFQHYQRIVLLLKCFTTAFKFFHSFTNSICFSNAIMFDQSLCFTTTNVFYYCQHVLPLPICFTTALLGNHWHYVSL